MGCGSGMLCELFRPTQPIAVRFETLAGLLHSVSVCPSSMISRDAVGAEIKLSTSCRGLAACKTLALI